MDTENSGDHDKTNPVATTLTGAVIGAGLGVAGTMILKNEKNRKKIKGAFHNLKDQVMKRAEIKKEELKLAGQQIGSEKLFAG